MRRRLGHDGGISQWSEWVGFYKAGRRQSLPSTDPGERIYAIGDVHGRFDLLTDLLKAIGEHVEAHPAPGKVHVILLGDLVDRGPSSLEVLNYIHAVQRRSPRMVVLAGNHEELMVRALGGDQSSLKVWLKAGGVPTLKSFGIEPPAETVDAVAFGREVEKALPPDLLKWVASLPLTARSGDYFFCHAGVRPGVPLDKQSRHDLLWIRDGFLRDERDHGAVVVHGHSISAEVEMCDNRIGLDTGAYRTNVLTAVCLQDQSREIITVQREAEIDPAPLSPADGG